MWCRSCAELGDIRSRGECKEGIEGMTPFFRCSDVTQCALDKDPETSTATVLPFVGDLGGLAQPLRKLQSNREASQGDDRIALRCLSYAFDGFMGLGVQLALQTLGWKTYIELQGNFLFVERSLELSTLNFIAGYCLCFW